MVEYTLQLLITMNHFITPQRKAIPKKYSTDDSSIDENDSPKRNVKRKLSFPEEKIEEHPPNESTSENTVCIISTFCI